MKWGLVGKGSIPHVARQAAWLRDLLAKWGEEVLLEKELGPVLRQPGHALAALDREVDLFATVGGDGTILWTQHVTDKPVLGINAGAIGFLTEVEPPQVEDALQRVLAGEYRVEERAKLAVTLTDGGGATLPDAVNEVTLQTSRIAKLIRFRVSVDDEVLDTYRGDGVIVSTPTGSTGYAMSVGGPLVHPNVEGVVLAPIAPFRLAARPWVVPATSRIELVLLPRDSAQGVQQARVVVDGQHGHDLEPDVPVRIERSRRVARYVRFGSGFYERVRTKLTR